MKELAGRIAALVRDHEESFRHRLVEEVLLPLGERNWAGVPWSEAGWYRGEPFDALVALVADRAAVDGLYPIPADCGTWYNAETDQRNGRTFRFFFGSAWLHRYKPEDAVAVELEFPHVVSSTVDESLGLRVDGARALLEDFSIEPDGSRRARFLLPESVPRAAATVRLTIECDCVEVPARIHPDNADFRRLSAAMYEPRFATAVADGPGPQA